MLRSAVSIKIDVVLHILMTKREILLPSRCNMQTSPIKHQWLAQDEAFTIIKLGKLSNCFSFFCAMLMHNSLKNLTQKIEKRFLLHLR